MPWPRRLKGRHVLLAAGVIGMFGTASALAAVNGAQRNPSNNTTSAYHRETQIIGDIAQGQGGLARGTGGFVTRQSNKSASGGGAVYGCRARSGTLPCVEAVNLATGHAFEFLTGTGADAVGRFLIGPDITKTVAKPPFLTNATGVVANLNADMVGGKHATDLVSTGQLLFAVVDAAGKLGSNRGATGASLTSTGTGTTGPSGPSGPGAVFNVSFGADVSKCAYTATPTAIAAGTTAAAPGAAGPGTEIHNVVVTEAGTASGFNLQVSC